jgi:hypothetical protein
MKKEEYNFYYDRLIEIEKAMGKKTPGIQKRMKRK